LKDNRSIRQIISQVAAVLLIFGVGIQSLRADPSLVPTRPTEEQFLKVIIHNWHELQARWNGFRPAQIKIQNGYLPLTALVLGQEKISIDNVWRKFRRRVAAGDIVWNPSQNRWVMAYDQGRSSTPESSPIEVVRGPMGYVIKDGHHDFFLALLLGGQTIAVKEVANYSKVDALMFWTTLKAQNAVYLDRSPAELVQDPPRVENVRDYPNRYFAALIAMKLKLRKKGKIKVSGPERPVWVKAGDSISFIEFYIADILTEAGLMYRPEWGMNIPPEVVEQAREAIHKAVQAGHPLLRNIPVIHNADQAQIARVNEFVQANLLRSPRLSTPMFCQAIFEL
jgi:hypothetical protein